MVDRIKSRDISKATSYETAIEIIPREITILGAMTLKMEFDEQFPDKSKVTVIPVMRGGKRVGEELTNDPNPMRMSYYDEENNRKEKPDCLQRPDINKIIVDGTTRDVVFAEGVVETEETIKAAMEEINKMIDEKSEEDGVKYDYPKYHVYALISKVNGSSALPDFVYAFKVKRAIWVHGFGTDNAEKGREQERIDGVLSPFATEAPEEPYYEPSRTLLKQFYSSSFSDEPTTSRP